MQANPRTVDTLFNSQSRYVVPMFQRLYVWSEDPQWQTLWEDVVEKAELQLDGKKANAHYLGALIIEGVRPSSPREIKRFLIIDGQQRLTTLQLLLCAFRDYARANGWTSLERTANRYLENADIDVMEKPDEERFKLWPTQLNRDVFSDIILAGSRAKVEAKHPLVTLPRKRKPEPRNPLINAYLYFHRRIGEWTKAASEARAISEESCAFSLLQALQQDFCVVEISLAEGDDSQEIFYSLNSQGRPLSQSDLLRSLIFMRAEKEQEDRDALFADYWGNFETSFWSYEQKRGGRTYSRLDLALRFFLTVKTATLIDARRVNEEYRRWISTEPPQYASVRAELADFSRYTEAYKAHEEAAAGLTSVDIRRVVRDLDVSTVLPLLLFLRLEAELSSEQLKDCLETVQSFLIRRAFSGEETKEYNKLFVEIVAALKGKKPAAVQPALERKLLTGGGTTRVWPSDERVMERAINAPIYEQMKRPALRLILERLEIGLRGKKSEETSLPDGLQIEHVMPQRWAANWPLLGEKVPPNVAAYSWYATGEWAHLADAIRARNIALQSLGNLSLVNGYLNPAANNGSFELKKAEYEHSVFRLNRYFEKKRNWDEAAIRARGKILGQAICDKWPRPGKLAGPG